jgi:hypothetical protein
MSSHPDLISHDCHHEEKVEAERPENQQFGAFEVASWNRTLLGIGELIMFERG